MSKVHCYYKGSSWFEAKTLITGRRCGLTWPSLSTRSTQLRNHKIMLHFMSAHY